MKKIIKKILIISSITIFIYSCTNNTGVSDKASE